ncbi:MAG: beta-ketoacyl synthase chain length factor [Ferruginibacter sp.]
MKIFIRSTASISAQETFGAVPFLVNPVNKTGDYFKAIEPSYTNILDPKLNRRMSRIIRMGVAAAISCLREAGIEKPGAIITGTAYGCLEDTGIFLSRIIEQEEQALSPTAFIQSTHNTIGAQVALMLGCNEYNNTFVHKGFSFETALLDSMMLLQEGDAKNVLVGAADEVTNFSHTILKRFSLYKKDGLDDDPDFQSQSAGTAAGEGAAFFLLSVEPSANDYAQLNGLLTFYKPGSAAAIIKNIGDFILSQSINISDIDLVITGRNSDRKHDCIYDELEQKLFNNTMLIDYKYLCGEYPTAVSFAMWLAAKILKAGQLPPDVGLNNIKKIKTILIYNSYLDNYHSLILMSAVNNPD